MIQIFVYSKKFLLWRLMWQKLDAVFTFVFNLMCRAEYLLWTLNENDAKLSKYTKSVTAVRRFTGEFHLVKHICSKSSEMK
jgi:hypothetical protein